MLTNCLLAGKWSCICESASTGRKEGKRETDTAKSHQHFDKLTGEVWLFTLVHLEDQMERTMVIPNKINMDSENMVASLGGCKTAQCLQSQADPDWVTTWLWGSLGWGIRAEPLGSSSGLVHSGCPLAPPAVPPNGVHHHWWLMGLIIC